MQAILRLKVHPNGPGYRPVHRDEHLVCPREYRPVQRDKHLVLQAKPDTCPRAQARYTA